MNKILFSMIIVLTFCWPVFSQPDPDLPDSLIIASAQVDSSGECQFVGISISARVDEPVGGISVRIHWSAPGGGVSIGLGTQYFYPLTEWDSLSDSVDTSLSCVQTIGIADMPGGGENPPLLIMDYQRHEIFSYRFVIAPNAPRQVVVLQECYPPNFEWAYLPGYITIGPLTGIESDGIATPRVLSLAQNYPNPFNPATTIEFAVAEEGHVTLEIFDLLGRRVATLADGEFEPGIYACKWDGADSPSGIYFYRLTTDTFAETKKWCS
jgi:hypothetical protein